MKVFSDIIFKSIVFRFLIAFWITFFILIFFKQINHILVLVIFVMLYLLAFLLTLIKSDNYENNSEVQSKVAQVNSFLNFWIGGRLLLGLITSTIIVFICLSILGMCDEARHIPIKLWYGKEGVGLTFDVNKDEDELPSNSVEYNSLQALSEKGAEQVKNDSK